MKKESYAWVSSGVIGFAWVVRQITTLGEDYGSSILYFLDGYIQKYTLILMHPTIYDLE